MKKFFLAILIVLAVAVALLPTTAVAQTNYQQTQEYLFMQEFCQKFPNRVAGTQQEREAGQFLAETFEQVVQGKHNSSVNVVPFACNERDVSANVVVTLDCPTSSEQVIVGAHYDAVGVGAGDNASGVTALWATLKAIANLPSLPCDFVFVAFGAEELGLIGSYYFVENMTEEQIENTLAMINFDSIANGDNLYVHCENVPTKMAQMFLQNSQNCPVQLLEKPHAVGTYNYDMFGYGYYEKIQGSDHTPFRTAGIPVASFFAGNFDFFNWTYVESTNANKQLMNTPNDTFEQIEQLNGQDFVLRIQTASQTVVNAVCSQDFLPILQNARGQLVNNYVAFLIPLYTSSVVALALVGIAILLGVLYDKKLQKRSILGTAEVKSSKFFSTPSADDIFTFKH